MFITQYIGRSLIELQDVVNPQGVCIFKLQNQSDTTGKLVAEEVSVKEILNKVPEMKSATVLLVNNFYGELILRVI